MSLWRHDKQTLGGNPRRKAHLSLSEDEPGRRSAAKLLADEALGIGRYFAEPSQSDFRTTHGGAPCPAMDSH